MSTSKAAPTANKPGHALLQGGHPTPVCAKPRVRDRIFETACDLFYKYGIRDVGVDTIATEAGTNKMSFYRSFASKDELVAEYLEQKGREFGSGGTISSPRTRATRAAKSKRFSMPT